MMDKRFFLTVGLCFGILFIWQNYISPPPKKKAAGPASAPTASAGQITPAQAAAGTMPTGAAGTTGSASAPVAAKLVRFEQPQFTAQISTVGGGLRDFILKDYKEGGKKRGEEKHPVQLVAESQEPITAATLLVGGQPFPYSDATSTGNRVNLSGESQGLAVDAHWALQPTEYTLEYAGTVTNKGAQAQAVQLALAMNGLYDEAKVKDHSMFEPQPDLAIPVFYDGSSMHRHKAEKTDSPTAATNVAWAGIDRQYFLLAAAPIAPPSRDIRFLESRVPTEPQMLRMQALLANEPQMLQPGASVPFQYIVYAGPKLSDRLRAPSRGFEQVTDYSFLGLPLGFIARPMLWVLNRAHDLVKNWGLAIIIVTVLLKMVMFPVTQRSFKSMQVMRDLKPELDGIKKRFPGDREKQGLETMRLYKERKVNPFLSGCLPALLQLPVWVAMWRMLASAVELYQKDFLWLADLTAKDPYYILPILTGVTTFIQQKISPPAGEPEQQKMMLYMMPPMFTLFMLGLPSGLVFYSFTNGILTVLQQTYITRRFAKPASPRLA